jgi:AcrR family transcriptional regulator
MDVPRQERSEDLLETGRVNQKRRTRAAIAAAAKDLLSQGVTPTVAQAAELAEVSRTTAYRYFPTQEALLIEVAVNTGVGDIEELVAQPLGAATVEDRMLAVLGALNRRVLEDEAAHRTALRLYLDMSLGAPANDDETPVVREGRRTRWIIQTLSQLDEDLSPAERRRLTAALSLVGGVEAIVTLRDVCRMRGDEALEVTEWAARALLRAALDEHQERSSTRTKATKRRTR